MKEDMEVIHDEVLNLSLANHIVSEAWKMVRKGLVIIDR